MTFITILCNIPKKIGDDIIQYKTKLKKHILGICSIIFISSLGVYAEGEILNGSYERVSHGSNYWNTSNLREWLNSSASDGLVKFTSNPPSQANTGLNQIYAYDKQAGFLKEFTNSERDAIARTERRTILGVEDRHIATNGKTGGISAKSNNTSSFKFNSTSSYQNFNNIAAVRTVDKVFLLNYKEIIDFYEYRDWNPVKTISNAASKKFNLSAVTTKNWWILYPLHNIGNERSHVVTNNPNDVNAYASANSIQGVAPAIHIKPDYRVTKVHDYRTNTTTSQTVNAGNLNIGDIIKFGTYMGESIEWRVLNFTNGYPLLQTEKIIDLKVYDAKGDKSYRYSYLDNDTSYDVSTWDYTSLNVNGTSDISLPTVEVLNENDLFQRQNGSFILNIKVSDNVGIKEITLPNNSTINVNSQSNTFTYTFDKNGFNVFTIKDLNGNCRKYVIPVGNINMEPIVQVTPSTTDWTNKNVSVSVSASNDVGWTHSGSYTQNHRDISGGSWGNYTTYAGKRIRVTGTVEYVSEKNNVNVSAYSYGMAFSYKRLTKSSDEYNVSWTYPGAHSGSVNSLKERKLNGDGPLQIDTVFTVPNDFFSNFSTRTHISVGAQDSGNITLKWSNVKYELLDNDDFAITKIQLPSGQDIFSTNYSHEISQEGELNHKYIIHDSRGMQTVRTITTRIDKTKPTINFSGVSNTPTNKDVAIGVTLSDNISGINSVEGPNYVSSPGGAKNSNFTYIVTENGSFKFTVSDRAGNVSTNTFTVSNIDKLKPVTSISGIHSYWKNGETIITIKAVDSKNDISKIEYSLEGAENKGWSIYDNSFKITTDGITTVKARSYDSAGNISDIASGMVKLDNTIPTGTFTVKPEVTSLNININASNLKDTFSGVSSIKVSNNADYSNNLDVSVANLSDIKIPFTLDTKSSLDEHYTERTIYITLLDGAKNSKEYIVKTTLLPNGNVTVIINESINDKLFRKDESIDLKWNIKCNDITFGNISQKRAKLKIENTKSGNIKTIDINGNTTSYLLRNLDTGVYNIKVLSYISDNVYIESNIVNVRIDVFKKDGNIITKEIEIGSPIKYISVITDHNIPKDTSISAYLISSYLENNVLKTKKEKINISNNIATAETLSLPENTRKIQIEINLTGNSTEKYLFKSPLVDSLTVFAR